MRPEKDKVVLTERDEFVVVGQAFSPPKAHRLQDIDAIGVSLNHLTQERADDTDPSWVIPGEQLMEFGVALRGVRQVYENLLAKEDSGDYMESASPEYKRLARLNLASHMLMDGIFRSLGVPPVESR